MSCSRSGGRRAARDGVRRRRDTRRGGRPGRHGEGGLDRGRFIWGRGRQGVYSG